MSYHVYARHGGAVGASQDDITDRVPAFDGNQPIIQMGMSCQTGSASQGTFIVPDPVGNEDASLYFPPHTQITWTEDASGDELWLAQGRISSWSIGRPDYKPGDSQVEWSFTVDDANVDLRGLAFTEDWVRPAETGVARLLALQAYTLNGSSSTRPTSGGVISYRPSTVITVSTSHLCPDSNTATMPAKTYQKDTQPLDVVTDCAETEGKVFGVVTHHTGGSSHACLLYIIDTDHATYASACKISDELSDWDPEDLVAPVFEPIYDQGDAKRIDGNANISGVVSRYGTNDQTVILLDADLGDDNEYWVDAVQDGQSVDATQAAAKAASVVAARSPYQETDYCSIVMLAEHVHLVEAGMSIQVKAAPVNTANTSTIGSYLNRRIVVCQKEPLPDGRYHVILQLNRPNRRPGSGGSLPASQLPAPDLVSPCPCVEPFTRTVAADELGLSPMGNRDWVIDSVSGGTVSVNGTQAVFDFSAETTTEMIETHLPINAVASSRFEVLALIRTDRNAAGPGTGLGQWLYLGLSNGSPSFPFLPGVVPSRAIFYLESTRVGGNIAIKSDMTFRQDGSSGSEHGTLPTIVSYPESGPGDLFWIRFRVTGNTAQIRGWLDSDVEPITWDDSFIQVPTQNYELGSGTNTELILVASGGGQGGSYTQLIWYVDYIEVISGIWCCASSPQSGQFITDQNIGYGNGTDTYLVYDAYVPGSLRVWVDGLEQTPAVTESDPTTGEFTFSFTPDDTEQIVVSYQVA